MPLGNKSDVLLLFSNQISTNVCLNVIDILAFSLTKLRLDRLKKLQPSWHLECIRNAYRTTGQYSQRNLAEYYTGTILCYISLQAISSCSFRTMSCLESVQNQDSNNSDFMSRACFIIRWYHDCFMWVPNFLVMLNCTRQPIFLQKLL